VLDGLDEMTVRVELSAQGFDGRVEHLSKLKQEAAEALHAEILLRRSSTWSAGPCR